MPDWSKIEQKIGVLIESPFQIKNHAELGGGDTNQAYQIDGISDEKENVSFFIKFNQKNRLDMFEAEAAGLQEIEKSQTMRVPHVVGSGIEGNQSYLILEKLSLTSGDVDSAKMFGQKLAKMHQCTSSSFGWFRDNTIGSTAQINTKQLNTGTDSWINFWREHRLGSQLKLAKQNGASDSLMRKGEKLISNLEMLFVGYQPEASLLHGDLWSGNYGYLKEGGSVVYDPALYYGDREADIAMTELFGGFSMEFYAAYNDLWPLDVGYQQRKTLYNLYHILNHFNIFGGGYAMQAEKMVEKLLLNF